MPNKMLIDASHPEETRVVVVRGSRIEEFDFESQDKKQLRGNIYLARVTRVEPSLQAAFVEYGGNRHGFLAFSEIHPDYYQIPVADRQALLKAEAEENLREEDEDNGSKASSSNGRKRRRNSNKKDSSKKAADTLEPAEAEAATDDAQPENPQVEAEVDHVEPNATDESSGEGTDNDSDDAKQGGPSMAAAIAADVVSEEISAPADEASNGDNDNGDDNNDEASEVDTVGAGDALEEIHVRRRTVRRQYKIQEVIKRRQILLVQVVKEERGNKGAALTTYLSLAGRYSVLMPNTARGGGISRKITNPQDRKRLKEVVKGLDVPEGMGVILRTAGENRTKPEIKRDYDYLMRLWESVRTLTLKSIAPALVYEEGSLIKRAVRDLYNKDIDQILVAGEEAYREAKDFMRMLMPSHAKVVQPYRDPQPVFARNGIEAQLDKILQPQVTLKSGGYIIINQTEALVAIDVNSGRSTKEHSIEDTALQTNLEAAEEVARQLRLRDLAGLIVIDFIDMEESRNNRAVEKRLKDCLKNDRARIQVGRISHFGLLEMSRQRIRSSVLESTMQPCPHCHGTGQIRSDSSLALLVMRAIEDYLLKDARNDIIVRTSPSTALYLLNQKRQSLTELENRFGVSISVETDDQLGHQHYAIAKGELSTRPASVVVQPAQADEIEDIEEDEIVAEDEVAAPAAQSDAQPAAANGEDGGSGRKRRRKRRRRGGRDRNGAAHAAEHDGDSSASAVDEDETSTTSDDDSAPQADESVSEDQPVIAEAVAEAPAEAADATAKDESADRGKRQRGRRGGRRSRAEGEAPEAEAAGEAATEAVAPSQEAAPAPASEPAAEPAAGTAETTQEPVAEAAPEAEEKPKPKPRRRPRTKKAAEEAAAAEAIASEAAPAAAPVETPAEAAPAAQEASVSPAVETEAEKEAEAEAPVAAKPASRGRRKAAVVEEKPSEPVVSSTEPAEAAPRKSGWWQRKSFF